MQKNEMPSQSEPIVEQPSKENLIPSTYANDLKNGLTSIWFGARINDFQSVNKQLDLKPHAALCLLIMATENATSSLQIQMNLHGFGGGMFDRKEAAIIAELGLYSLRSIGYIKLDAKGEKELTEHTLNTSSYGLGSVRWLLTSKGARRIAPTYCAAKGLPSSHQDQAVKDMLAANKAAIAKCRNKQSIEA